MDNIASLCQQFIYDTIAFDWSSGHDGVILDVPEA